MNVTPSMIYWISAFDNMREVAVPISVIGMIAGVIATIMYGVTKALEDEDDCAKAAAGVQDPVLKRFVGPAVAVSLAILAFAPSSKTLAAMYIVPAIANNEKVQDVGNKLYELSVEWLEELKPSTHKGEQK